MSISLDTIKDLRSRGASIQMQDDLASFLEGETYKSGYDSPLFLPTMDFILLLQNQVKSQEVEQEQSIDLSNFDIPQVYDPTYFDKISIKAAGEMIKGADIATHAKEALLAYLDNLDIQRAKHLGLIGEQGQEIATGRSVQRRAQISNAKRKDRNTGKIKSMFESLVSSLNALQVSITNANAAKTKAIQQESLAQQIQQQKSNWRDLLVRNTNNAVNSVTSIFKRSKKTSDISGRKSDRSFIKSMRKAFRVDKNENDGGNNSDSQLGRINAKDIFQQKNAKNAFGVVVDKEEEKAKLDTNLVQVIASKAIDSTKKNDKSEKTLEIDTPKDVGRNKNTADLQARMQRSRSRMQQQRNEIQQKAEAAQRIDDMTAEKAVKQLQSLGVSMSDASAVKSNKDLDALAKAQDKQRGS